MRALWERSVFITASRTESGRVDLKIVYGLTGPMLVMSIGDERVVIASRWKEYTTEHGVSGVVDAINAGVRALKDLK